MARDPRQRPRPRPGPRSGAARPARSRPSVREAVTTRPRSRFTGRAAVMLLVMLVLVISYASSLRAWLQQQDELRAARAEITRAEGSISDLQRDKRRWNDDAYVEQQARERFGWVNPGEVGYRVVDANGTVLGNESKPPVRATGEPDGPDWYTSLWGTVEKAGEKPEKRTRDANDVIVPDADEIAPKDDESSDD
ncbi:FtsB family cell division protein [Solicola sp. PLA-1-18]|uniref:FtsB family cell division protein n=1 Tax=Solicola sp. PLA-1-18 TaxID=3380532 RepID=UPI003B7DB2E9